MAKPNVDATNESMAAAAPDGPRRAALALLYAALANDLVQWKAKHPGTSEQDPTAAPPPVIVQLHAIAQAVVTDAKKAGVTLDLNGSVPDATLAVYGPKMNTLLRDNRDNLGGVVHALDLAQVNCLVYLMVVHETYQGMAPYEPPPYTRAW